MKNLKIFAICLTLIFMSCSSESEQDLDTTTPNPSTSIVKFFELEGNMALNQYNVFHFKSDGTVKEYDYEDSVTDVRVNDGDEILVSCKVGEELLPEVPFRVYSDNKGVKFTHQKGYLYSDPNSASEYGFRLMKTADGKERLKIGN